MRRLIILIIAQLCNILCFAQVTYEEGALIKIDLQDTDTILILVESDSLFVRGKSFYNKKEYTEAISYFLKSDSVINAHYGVDCPYYGYGKMWGACCFHKLGLDSIALDYSTYYDKEPIDKLLTHSSDSVVWVALRLIELGQIKNALVKLLEAARMEKNELGPNSYWYANTLSNCAGLCNEIKNYEKATELGKEAVEIYKATFGVEHIEYAYSLINLATFYSNFGNNSEALRLGTEAIGILKRTIGTDNPNYATSLSDLAVYNSEVGNYSEAVRLGTEAMEIRKRILGTDYPAYATSLNNLAINNSYIGNYSEAIRLGTEAMELYKKTQGTEDPYYAMSLGNLALYYNEFGNYSEAIRLGTEAMELYKKIYGSEHPDYAWSLHNLATYKSKVGSYSEAIRLETKAMEIRKRVLGKEHPLYATSLYNLATGNSVYGNYAESIRLGTEAMEILKRTRGTEHSFYIQLLDNLAWFYMKLGNYLEAFNCLHQCLSNSQSVVLRDFTEFSSRIQETMWNNKYASKFTTSLPNIAIKYQTKQSFSELYDKTCLFAKGILLNTGIEIRKLILESGDSVIIDKFNALASNISIYNKLLEKPIKERIMDADSLNRVIEQQEMALARDSKAYGDYTHNLTINWKDVQRGLGDDDIAIEFLDFPIYNSDSTMYVALTLKNNYDCPRMVTLFEEKQLKAISEDVYYTNTYVSDLIWKPLEEELKGIRNVYFAPSGELHRIGIEYLPIGKTEIISDVYTLYRLSSTRQLALIQDETKGKNSIIYGGINYDEKSSTMPTDTASAEGDVFKPTYSRANVDSLSLRSSFDYLEGTKREADMIVKDMEQHHVPYVYYNGIDGTEESFKQQDGTKPKLMHIATHGFYFTKVEAKQTQFARPEMDLQNEGIQKVGRFIEDKPMTRSGLLFSGCNRVFRHEQISECEEDGILTAQEISMLDLRGLDLVVLSACQTGLGDVISGEGVFGLQRGFKKAGAKTILMSLNKVDDEATRILMVKFYRNLMNGKTKYQSLRDSQRYLRKVENGKYDDPKYWASFIMLDGLN